MREQAMQRSRFCDEQIVGFLKEYRAGLSATELCGRYGVSDATFRPDDADLRSDFGSWQPSAYASAIAGCTFC